MGTFLITLDIKTAYFQVQYPDTFLGRDTVYSGKSAPTFRSSYSLHPHGTHPRRYTFAALRRHNPGLSSLQGHRV